MRGAGVVRVAGAVLAGAASVAAPPGEASAATRFGTPSAASNVVVAGGMEAVLAPDLAAEFQIVPPGEQFVAAAVNSRAAQAGFLNNDCTFGVLQNCSWSPLGAATPVDFSVSVVPLTEAQVQSYNAGAGVTDGPVIQFPLYGWSVAIATMNSAITKNGMLVLGDGELCGIFSGQITDWSQFSYLAAPGGFDVIYDSGANSAATWLLTQHLNAVCDATNSAFTQLPVPITGNFAALPVPGGVANNPRFVAATGPTAVQSAILADPSAVSYLPTNYTSITPHSPVTAAIVAAALYNPADGKTYIPTNGSLMLALNTPGQNAVNATPPANPNQAADATHWVPQLPTPGAGYPIVGYANWILSTCYRQVSAQILQYLTAPYSAGKHATLQAASGLIPLPMASPAYQTAVNNILLSNQDGYNLQIQNPVACHGRVRNNADGN